VRRDDASTYDTAERQLINTASIRNFAIIAHIDHGKSTLADRLLELTGLIPEREMREQFLDSMELERERGITIKAQTVRMEYAAADKATYVLNLVDTPGHVDFAYEVSRSLASCEGAVLLVDAAQGVEAQTLANCFMALDAGLEIVPALNKIDLPVARPDEVAEEVAALLGVDPASVLRISAKTGEGITRLIDRLIRDVPAPKGDPGEPLRALIFDSYYDKYRGVVSTIRVVDGTLVTGDRITLMAAGATFEAEEVGVFTPYMTPVDELGPGEIGYLIAGIKSVSAAKVGDTITKADNPAPEPLAGYREPKQMVYCGLYPLDGDQYSELRSALEKLSLNDSSFSFEPETSKALGFGFRCGFLGLLHMDISKERIEREYGVQLLATAPTVEYRIHTVDGEVISARSAAEWVSGPQVSYVEEPIVRATIIAPAWASGGLIDLCQQRRGRQVDLKYLSKDRIELVYILPLSEVIFDFNDQLKSRSKGYASLDYEPAGYQKADLVKVDILVAGSAVDAFSSIVAKEKAYSYGRGIVERLRQVVPRQLFDVALQAAVGSRVIARETIKAKRKDVLAKCYGGDVTRKRKLLERQKAGKKRMKMIGSVEIPQEAFTAVMGIEEPKSGSGKSR
jgi:GTP-binding protein LepA